MITRYQIHERIIKKLLCKKMLLNYIFYCLNLLYVYKNNIITFEIAFIKNKQRDMSIIRLYSFDLTCFYMLYI